MKERWQQLLRIGFHLLYYQFAWTYDLVSWTVSLGDWRSWQRAAIPFLQSGRVLEIAHGPGHMLLALDAAGYQTLGLDLSPYMSRQAQRRLRGAGVRVPLVLADVQMLPIAEASFDSALATFPTDFIARPETLSAVFRVLRPGGRLVIVPEGHLTGRAWPQRMIGWLFAITGQGWPEPVDGDEPRLSRTQSWKRLEQRLGSAGFAVQLTEVRFTRSAVSIVVAEKPLRAPEFV